jgi:hypothetical protein
MGGWGATGCACGGKKVEGGRKVRGNGEMGGNASVDKYCIV